MVVADSEVGVPTAEAERSYDFLLASAGQLPRLNRKVSAFNTGGPSNNEDKCSGSNRLAISELGHLISRSACCAHEEGSRLLSRVCCY
jgi:hypothetical protein